MNDIVKILPNFKKFNDYISNVKDNTSPIMLSGLTDSGKVHFAYSTYFYAEKPICIITYNELQAKKIIRNLEYFENNINYFPKKEILAYDYLAESKDITYSRIACLNEIHKKQAKIIVTTIEALSQKIIPEDVLYKNILELKIGDVINLEEIKQKLVLLGYERQDVVENKSEFSVRGGIIDVAISEKQGIRIELWGDEIDSIRTFDINTQRSLEKRENIKIYPAHEFLLDKPLEEVAKDIQDQRDKEEILEGNFTNKIDKYWNKFYNNPDNTFIDYIKDNYIIFIDEVSKIKARSENVIKDTKLLMQNLVEKKRYIPELLEKIEDYIEFLDRIKSIQTIYLENKDIGFVDKQSMHAKRNGYSFSYREVNFFRSSMDLLFKEVQEGLGQGTTIAILCGNQNNIKRTKDLLAEKINNPKQLQKLIITEGSLTEGFECYDFNLLVISIEELFNIPKKKRKTPEQFKAGETIIFSDLKVGDYIVHRTNGVGQFVGINTIQAAGVTKDYIKIKYKDDGILYVPTSSLDNVKKYIGSGDGAPRLNKLGSKDWAKAKARVKSNLQEIAKDLIELYAKREKAKGFMFSKDTEWQKEFEQKFPYTETNDQLRSIEEMKKDMESTAESVEKVEPSNVEGNKEKTYTRDEVNKMINAEKQKERQAMLEEMEAKKAEADKLAKMDEDQKKSYELEQERARANKAENELNAYRLKDETIRQANQRGISLGYIDTIDFSRETAESINSKLDIFEKVSKADREKAINEYSKEPAPQTGDSIEGSKPESQMTYEELCKLSKYKN